MLIIKNNRSKLFSESVIKINFLVNLKRVLIVSWTVYQSPYWTLHYWIVESWYKGCIVQPFGIFGSWKGEVRMRLSGWNLLITPERYSWARPVEGPVKCTGQKPITNPDIFFCFAYDATLSIFPPFFAGSRPCFISCLSVRSGLAERARAKVVCRGEVGETERKTTGADKATASPLRKGTLARS